MLFVTESCKLSLSTQSLKITSLWNCRSNTNQMGLKGKKWKSTLPLHLPGYPWFLLWRASWRSNCHQLISWKLLKPILCWASCVKSMRYNFNFHGIWNHYWKVLNATILKLLWILLSLFWGKGICIWNFNQIRLTIHHYANKSEGIHKYTNLLRIWIVNLRMCWNTFYYVENFFLMQHNKVKLFLDWMSSTKNYCSAPRQTGGRVSRREMYKPNIHNWSSSNHESSL